MRKSLVLVAFIAMISFALGGVAMASHDFPDVPDSHPFHDDISWLASTGIAEGFPDGTYRPGQAVTRQSMAAFMRRLAGADPAVPRMVDAAELAGRSAADFDDAKTLDGLESTDLIRREGFAQSTPLPVTGTTPATATAVIPAFDTGFNRVAVLSAVVDTSYDSSLLSCLNGDQAIHGLTALKIGDSAVGFSDRVSVMGLFDQPAAGAPILCFVQNAVGTGTIELEETLIWYLEV